MSTTEAGSCTFHANVTCVKVGALGVGTSTAIVIWLTNLLAPLDLRHCLMAVAFQLSAFGFNFRGIFQRLLRRRRSRALHGGLDGWRSPL